MTYLWKKISRENILHGVVLTLLITIIYIPSLDVPFIFDDMPNIVLNLSVHAEKPAQLQKAFHSGVSGTRPLAMLSFAFNHLLSGLDVFGFHVFNIGVHILNTLLLYLILLIIPAKISHPSNVDKDTSRNAKYAFWAAALWAVNPVQTQAVTYIVQRMTSMATFFYLAGIYIFLLWRRGSCRTNCFSPLVFVFFIAGMACKEIVITLPFTLFLIDYIFYPEKFRKNLLPLTIVVVISFFLCLYYLQGNFPEWTATYPNRNFSPLERVMTQWRVLWHYLSLFIFPLPERLHLTYNFPVSTGFFSPWTTFLSLSAIIITLVCALFARKNRPVLSFAILFFFLTSALEASFVNLELVFIHRMYLPSLFFSFAIISLIQQKLTKQSGVLFIVVIAILSYWTISRNDEWTNPQHFWQSNIERGALTARAKNNTAAALMDHGRFQEALDTINKGLKIAAKDEDRKLLMYNRGFVLYYMKNYPASLDAFRDVIEDFGAFRHSALFIGLIYIHQGKTDKALDMVKQLNSHEKIAYQGEILMSNILYEEEKYTEAERIITQAIEKETYRQIYIRQRLQMELAKIYLKQNRPESAYKIFLDMIERYPQNYTVWKMIHLMLESGGDKKSAEKVKRFLEQNSPMKKD